ncbi:NUDIX hydrolase [Sphaerisporangium rufum]|uniref:NUDIX hydrolase n=1 Tax=Sphaerisporangium rufum TaxID=1381558 RepID=UPI00194F762E|nr:NUDIX domain-containing protein [Sphaerisporangium rufum]
MAISDSDILATVSAYLERYADDTLLLSEPLGLLSQGKGFASRRNFVMHVTASALLVRNGEILLIDHLAYGIPLQPGGHLEPADATLIDAALRELTEETGVDPRQVFPASPIPVYVEYGLVPPRPEKNEPAHHHLDIGYAFMTNADVGRIQESEVGGAAWYPLAAAERLVGTRIARAVSVPVRTG